MGKAGFVLRQVLERNSVYRWANEKSDRSGETIVEIVKALKTLHPLVAKAFVERYLGEEVKDL